MWVELMMLGPDLTTLIYIKQYFYFTSNFISFIGTTPVVKYSSAQVRILNLATNVITLQRFVKKEPEQNRISCIFDISLPVRMCFCLRATDWLRFLMNYCFLSLISSTGVPLLISSWLKRKQQLLWRQRSCLSRLWKQERAATGVASSYSTMEPSMKPNTVSLFAVSLIILVSKRRISSVC